MFNLPFIKKRNQIKPVVLVVLDGFGNAPPSNGNAITLARTPNIDNYKNLYPKTELIASGESVGLPANEVGNTEVGHLTMGAGRVILQDLKRISLAIEKGSFFDNKAFVDAASHVKTNNSNLHILGLVSSGSVHSSLLHLFALLQFCKKEGVSRVKLHLFTDGRDAPQREGIEIIQKIEERLKILRLGQIATVSGRYYAMDRDRRWDRIEKAYNAIVQGLGVQVQSASDAMNNAYKKGQTDEFVEPSVVCDVNGPCGIISDNDAAIFFNYRIDRALQLSMALCMPDFEKLKDFDFGKDEKSEKNVKEKEDKKTFSRQKIVKNLYFASMTEYNKKLPVSNIAFTAEVVEKSLGQVISEANLKQLRMAESEKERFVTYYFSGMKEGKFEGEDVKIIPSPKVPTYDRKPEMSLPKLTSELIKSIKKDIYHFVVVNFANPDMVGHTGNLNATIIAIEKVDKYLSDLVDVVLKLDGTLLVTGDHGNAEELITYPTSTYFVTTSKGVVNTDHSNNPVPLYVISNSLRGSNVPLQKGALCDVAPTVLRLLGLEIPKEMKGKDLFSKKPEKSENQDGQNDNISGYQNDQNTVSKENSI